jgi:hypothetical protein
MVRILIATILNLKLFQILIWHNHDFYIYYPDWSLYSTVFYIKNFVKNRIRRSLLRCVDCAFKSSEKLNHDILDSLNQSKINGHYKFPPANPQIAAMLDFVPTSNPTNKLILLYLCSANLKSVSHFHNSRVSSQRDHLPT